MKQSDNNNNGPMTNSEYQARYNKRMRLKGFSLLRKWVPAKAKSSLEQLILSELINASRYTYQKPIV